MVIRNKFFRGTGAFIGASVISLVAIIFFGFVIPSLVLARIYSEDNGDGPPGIGLWLVLTLGITALISLIPLITYTLKFYAKLSPKD